MHINWLKQTAQIPKFQLKRNYLIVALVFAILLILSKYSLPTAAVLKVGVSIFAAGLSYVKVSLFLGWGALCYSLLAVGPKFNRNPSRRFVLLLVSGAALSALLTHGLVNQSLSVPVTDRYYIFDHGHLSVNGPFHTHTQKSMIMLLGVFQGEKRFDPGVPFRDLVPSWAVLLSAFFWVSTALILVSLLIGPAARSLRQRPALGVAYIVAAFSVLKNLIDGGPLAREFVISAPVLFLILGEILPANDHISRRPISLKKLLIILGGYALIHMLATIIVPPETEVVDAMSFLFAVGLGVSLWSVFVLLFAIDELSLSGTRWPIISRIGLISMILIIGQGGNFALNELIYLFKPLQAGQEIRFNDTDRTKATPRLFKTPYTVIYQRPVTWERRILDVVVAERLNTSFYPVNPVVPSGLCTPSQPYYVEVEVQPIDSEHWPTQKSLPATSPIQIVDQSNCESSPCRRTIMFKLQGCTPDPKKVITGTLALMGLEHFIFTYTPL